MFIELFQSSATNLLQSSLVLIPSSANLFLIFLNRFQALALIIYLLATFRNMSTSRFLIAKWLFSKTSHFGKVVMFTSVGTTTLSELISVENLWVSFVLIWFCLVVMKFWRFTWIPSTNSSVAGGSPMHSKNLMPFSLSRSSRDRYSFKKAISFSDIFILFAVFASLSSFSGLPLAPVVFLKLFSGILSSNYAL